LPRIDSCHRFFATGINELSIAVSGGYERKNQMIPLFAIASQTGYLPANSSG
jgi:hypothetical protein